MLNNFQLYSKYYNLIYSGKDYDSEVNYIISQLEIYSPHTKSILEFGSGTGGHGLLLQKRGYKIYGLEKSEDMVDEAKKKDFPCQVADICNFKLSEEYDAVVALFHVVSYITENHKLITMFQNAHQHLKKNGIFLFDVWYSPAVYNLKPETRIKRIDNKDLNITRIVEPSLRYNENIVDVNIEMIVEEKGKMKIQRIKETHPMRHFSIPEIELFAKYSGFEILKVEEFLTGRQPSEETWGVCFVLRKVQEKKFV